MTDDEDLEDARPAQKKSVWEEKEDKLKQAMDTLNNKHGSKYTQMQHQTWSELHANGMHTDLETLLNNSMFNRLYAMT